MSFGQITDDEALLIQTLISHNNDNTFLSNLRWLSCWSSSECIPLLRRILPSCIESIDFDGMYVHASDKWNLELQTLACTTPSLTAARGTATALHHLRSLKLPDAAVASDVVAQFLALPNLEHLDCKAGDPLFQLERLVEASSLRELSLRARSPLTIVSSLISRLRAPHLSAIKLDVCCERCEPDETLALFQHLDDATSTSSLQELEFTVWWAGDDDSESLPSVALRDILFPMFSRKDMRKLVLTFNDAHVVTFTDDDLRAVLEAWSHLEKLHISLPFQKTKSFPDVAALEYVARQYQRLTTLAIPMDIIHEPILPINPPLASHPLAELTIHIRQYEPHIGSGHIAKFIDTLFPNLNFGDCRKASFIDFVDEECKTRWLDTWRKLRELRRERMGESEDAWDEELDWDGEYSDSDSIIPSPIGLQPLPSELSH